MSRALNAVLDELPNVRLDPDHEAPVMHGLTGRSGHEIHVVFDA